MKVHQAEEAAKTTSLDRELAKVPAKRREAVGRTVLMIIKANQKGLHVPKPLVPYVNSSYLEGLEREALGRGPQ